MHLDKRFINVINNMSPRDLERVFGESNPTIVELLSSVFVGKYGFRTSLYEYTLSILRLRKMVEVAKVDHYTEEEIKMFWHSVSYLKPYNLNVTMVTNNKGLITKIKLNKKTFIRFSIKPSSKYVADIDTVIEYLYKHYSR